jgi:hypothetical protein
VDPVPDPLLRRTFGSTGNRTPDLWLSSHERWPLGHRGGPARQDTGGKQDMSTVIRGKRIELSTGNAYM